MNIYFGENLKSLRQKHNLTQERLSEFLNVSFQTISKWERGDTYPDIAMLPEIALFFKVSVDELLGVNKAESEEKLLKQLEVFDNLTDSKQREAIIIELKKNYPNDYRVILRYMTQLIHFSNPLDVMSKVTVIYENIQENCNNDKIRVSAKRHLAEYYKKLAEIEGSGITFDDCEKLLDEMPRMKDSQEILRSFLYPENHPEYFNSCVAAIETSLNLLCQAIAHLCFYNDKYSVDYKIDIVNKCNNLLTTIYDDGNYGEAWRVIIFNNGHLGRLHFLKGETDRALEYFKKAATLAKQFDSLERKTTLNSQLLKGKEFNKHSQGSNWVAKEHLEFLLNERYPLSEEFKNSEDFKSILA
ncbi:MAG: helix-turn-helix transcriptional regulator [Ruminococcaceae bacterium]|nr:helix-turn-helix transcriptional regulator [Oscillospiraceae bacterium]